MGNGLCQVQGRKTMRKRDRRHYTDGICSTDAHVNDKGTKQDKEQKQRQHISILFIRDPHFSISRYTFS